jgi:hypothetical protein
LQSLRIGSIVAISVGTSQTSDINNYSGATITNVSNAYVEFTDAGSGLHAYPWHRVLSITVTTP